MNINFKLIISFVVVCTAFVYLFSGAQSAYADDTCPSIYHCKSIADSAKILSCPEGKICIPINPAPGCPPSYVCFLTVDMPSTATGGSAGGTTSGSSGSSGSTGTSVTSGGSTGTVSVNSFSAYSGYQGDRIYIYGSGFSSSTLVVFSNSLEGNYSATLDAISATRISFVISSYVDPGTYTVTVANQNALMNGKSFNFVVLGKTSTNSSVSTSAQSTSVTSTTYVPSVSSASTVSSPLSYAVNNSNVVASTNGYIVGQRIQSTVPLKVRSIASLSGSVLSIQAAGSPGIILAIGGYVDGYSWVKVKYDTGITGWSAASYITPYIQKKSTNTVISAVSSSVVPVKTTDTFSLSLSSTTSQKGTFSLDGTNPSLCFNFKQDLSFGAGSGSLIALSKDVADLQTALTAEGFSIKEYERGQWANFGASTLAAAIKFQDKYGITPDVGYVGPLTRAKLNSLYNCY